MGVDAIGEVGDALSSGGSDALGSGGNVVGDVPRPNGQGFDDALAEASRTRRSPLDGGGLVPVQQLAQASQPVAEQTAERAERIRQETAERAERIRQETAERAERARQETAERAERIKRETAQAPVTPPVRPPTAETPVTPPVTPPAAETPVTPPVTPPTAETPVTPPPPPPATTEEIERAVTHAVDELLTAEHNLELADVATRGELARARADAQARLDQALQRAADELRTAQHNLELADVATRGELARARADALARLDQAVQPYLDRVIAPLLGQADPPADALAALSTRISTVAPEVHQRVLADPRVQALVQRGADWVNQPLAQGPRVGPEAQVPGRQAAERLNQLTAQLDPRLGVAVVNAAAPAWESFNQNYRQTVGPRSMLGPTGMRELMMAADRIYAAEGGQQAVARFAQMGHFNADAVRNALAEGIGPAYALEYVRANAADINVAGALEAITEGIQGYANGPVADLASQYARHHEELAWLVHNHGRAMTPEALNNAIANYVQSRGPEWQAEAARLEQALAAQGARLLNQFNQVADFARSMQADPNLASHRAALLSRTAEIAARPEAMAAATAAIRHRPELLDGAAGLRTLDTIEMLSSASNNARASNSFRRLFQEGVTFYMKRLIDNIVRADVSTPEAIERARANLLHGLRDGRFARALGVSDKHYNMAVNALEAAIPRPGETPDQRTARLREFDRRLEQIYETDDGVKSFSRFTPPGQIMRVAGLALSGITAAFSGVRAYEDPTAANNFKLAVDGIGLGQKFADFALGLSGERTPADHWLRHVGGTDATRIFGRLTAAADVGIATQYLMRGDPGAAFWTGVTATGGFIWSVGSSAWSGPVGFGLVLAGNIGLEVHRGRQEAAKFETPTSATFLRHSGLSPEAASALVVQSHSGHSPVPLLFEYGRLRGLSQAETAAWLNSLTPRQLESLRNAVHLRLDQVNGDLSTFTAGTPEDRQYVNQMLELGRRRSPYQLLPDNAVRMDGLLEGLGIPRPRP